MRLPGIIAGKATAVSVSSSPNVVAHSVTGANLECLLAVDKSYLLHHGEDMHYRPYLHLDGHIKELRSSDDLPFDINVITFDKDNELKVAYNYDFSDDELAHMVSNGLFTKDFACPKIFYDSDFELPVACDLSIIEPNEDTIPITIVSIINQYDNEINTENSGYTLGEYFSREDKYEYIEDKADDLTRMSEYEFLNEIELTDEESKELAEIEAKSKTEDELKLARQMADLENEKMQQYEKYSKIADSVATHSKNRIRPSVMDYADLSKIFDEQIQPGIDKAMNTPLEGSKASINEQIKSKLSKAPEVTASDEIELDPDAILDELEDEFADEAAISDEEFEAEYRAKLEEKAYKENKKKQFDNVASNELAQLSVEDFDNEIDDNDFSI